VEKAVESSEDDNSDDDEDDDDVDGVEEEEGGDEADLGEESETEVQVSTFSFGITSPVLRVR